MHRVRPEEIARDEGDHAGRAAPVPAHVDDQGVGVGQEIERRRGGGPDPLRLESEAPQLEVTHVTREPLDLLEPEVDLASERPRARSRFRGGAPMLRDRGQRLVAVPDAEMPIFAHQLEVGSQGVRERLSARDPLVLVAPHPLPDGALHRDRRIWEHVGFDESGEYAVDHLTAHRRIDFHVGLIRALREARRDGDRDPGNRENDDSTHGPPRAVVSKSDPMALGKDARGAWRVARSS